MHYLAFGVALMFILIAAELLYLRRRRTAPIPWREIATNINAGHCLLWLFRGVEVLAFGYLSTHLNLGWVSDWSLWLLAPAAFVAFDFSYYWSHRTHHALPLLWHVHSVHHQGRHFSLSMGIRNSWFSVLTSFPFFAWLAVVGVPVEVYIVVGAVNYFIQFYNHNGVVNRTGWLEHVLITPVHHQVHHGCNRPYIDKNHGGVFVLWDKLFGTFQARLDAVPIQFGTKSRRTYAHPVRANLLPLLGFFGKTHWLRSRPRNRRPYSNGLLVCSSLALSAIFALYIYAGYRWSPAETHALFAYLLVGVVALGGIAEGSRAGLWGWCLLTLLGSPLLVVAFSWTTLPVVVCLFLLLMGHGLLGLLEHLHPAPPKTTSPPSGVR